jgi:hypothetical protein
MGMHTMEYRARAIGGTLTVAKGTDGGTTILCRARRQRTQGMNNYGQQQGTNDAN